MSGRSIQEEAVMHHADPLADAATLDERALPRAAGSPGVWASGFVESLAAHADMVGYAGVAPDVVLDSRATLEGKLPAGLRGTFFRNGPALHELGGQRYHHWLDGDGMVQAFRFTDQGVHHTGRLVLTEKLAGELRAGRRRRSVFGTAIADAEPPTGPDSLNVANTSVLPFGSELLALWEGGSAHRLEAETLATIGPKVWRPDLKGMPFSAHPRVTPDGTVWNFGLDTAGSLLALYEISAAGQLARAEVLALPGMAMVHDFAVTARHLLFLLPPFGFDGARLRGGQSFLDSHLWLPGAALRVLVVEKADLRTHRVFELPTAFVFHLGNAWEDDAGVIRFDYVRSRDPSTMMVKHRDLMRGLRSAGSPAASCFVTLDLRSGRIGESIASGDVEFPRVDPRVVGERYRNLYLVADNGGPSGRHCYDAIRRVDVGSGKVDEFRYGDGFQVEEHIVVPDRRDAREGAGWLVGTALDLRTAQTVVSVFDATDLAAGPVARARLPYALPLGLHGSFAAA
jgi:carotenoid cleavage dioxygenase-like enzyme